MDKLKRGEFLIAGRSSLEVNSLIQERPEIQVPHRKMTMIQVPGVSGDYIIDDEAYENTTLNIKMFLKGKSEEEVIKLKGDVAYLFSSGDYLDFVPYWDSEMVYQVIAINPPRFVPDGQTPHLVDYEVELSVKPFKHYRQKFNYGGSTSITLNNPTTYESHPTIRLIGSGDMDLTVNGEVFRYRNVDGNISIDSETFNSYKEVTGGVLNRNDRVFQMPYPVLKPGTNTVSVTGASNISVEPRWKQLVS